MMIRDIIAATADHFGLTYADLLADRRSVQFAHARQVAAYIARSETLGSYPVIARAFNRDHSTIVHAVQRITDLLRSNHPVRVDIEAITARARIRSGEATQAALMGWAA